MPRAKISPTIELEYDTFGDPKNPALVLIEGHGAQMAKWDPEYCKMFAAKNLYVIRFDNRDCGLSTKFDGVKVDLNGVITAALMEEPVPPVPYTLSDMAADVVGLLDFLKIDRAHIFGVSLGGMIAQIGGQPRKPREPRKSLGSDGGVSYVVVPTAARKGSVALIAAGAAAAGAGDAAFRV